MPSRCAFESRPFLELPKPFLCAISDFPGRDGLQASVYVALNFLSGLQSARKLHRPTQTRESTAPFLSLPTTRAAPPHRSASPQPTAPPATDRPALRLKRLSVHADAGDLYRSVRLAMSLQLLVLLLALQVEHQNLVASALFDHLAGHKRRRGLGNLALGRAHRQHVVKLHVFAARLRQL